jgi:HAD superfamily hydrolase (TIGR01509 family)
VTGGPAPAWGALFDWDGVLVDSSRFHELSWEALARESGLPLPEGHFRRGYGMKNEQIIPDLLRWTQEPAEVERLSRRKEVHFRELVRRHGIGPLPGVREWLARLDAAGIPRVIASSTHRENITTILALIGLGGFADVVAAEDVTLGKPDPQVFLVAARRVGVPPERAVVFEDTHAGIAAARAGGMRVVAVAGTHPAERLGEADLVVERMDELSVEQLGEWFQRG